MQHKSIPKKNHQRFHDWVKLPLPFGVSWIIWTWSDLFRVIQKLLQLHLLFLLNLWSSPYAFSVRILCNLAIDYCIPVINTFCRHEVNSTILSTLGLVDIVLLDFVLDDRQNFVWFLHKLHDFHEKWAFTDFIF